MERKRENTVFPNFCCRISKDRIQPIKISITSTVLQFGKKNLHYMETEFEIHKILQPPILKFS